jgi:hypothetical protein
MLPKYHFSSRYLYTMYVALNNYIQLFLLPKTYNYIKLVCKFYTVESLCDMLLLVCSPYNLRSFFFTLINRMLSEFL